MYFYIKCEFYVYTQKHSLRVPAHVLSNVNSTKESGHKLESTVLMQDQLPFLTDETSPI